MMMHEIIQRYINIEHARKYVRIGEGVLFRDWALYVQEAFDFDVASIFCPEFLAKLVENTDSDDWRLFFEGGKYGERYYRGFWQALTYLAYARMLVEHPTNITTHGVVEKRVDYSEPVQIRDRHTLAKRFFGMGETILWDLVEFMNESGFEWWTCGSDCQTGGSYHSTVIQ
jgi:hypothetical protein